jgi:dTDP-4-dehydrorhamnose reductase
MKVLVTGANGQVGYWLQQQLHEQGWNFVALARSELDISDADAVDATIDKIQPQVIINAAAYTAVDKAEQEPTLAYLINRDGPANLARSANNIGAAILHISTDYVFSGDANSNYCYCEDDTTNPQSVYGKSKLEGEQAVISANNKHIILRTAWVFGEHGNNFVKTMIHLGRTRETLNIVADQEGGPTYAKDIAKTALEITKHYAKGHSMPWGIYHYAGLPYTNWYDFATHIFTEIQQAGLYDKAIPHLNAITSAEYPTPAKRPTNSKLDCTKLEDAFGIIPSNWRAALKNIRAYSV